LGDGTLRKFLPAILLAKAFLAHPVSKLISPKQPEKRKDELPASPKSVCFAIYNQGFKLLAPLSSSLV